MKSVALRAGWTGGLIELRQSFSGSALIGQLFWPAASLVAMFFLRDKHFGAGTPALGTVILPGVLGMFIALGMILVIQYLAADREDGTLLRAKATPNGIPGYLISKLVTVSGSVLAYLAIIVIPGLLILDGLQIDGVNSWFTIAWVLILGLVATQALGAILGSLISSPRGVGYVSIPVIGLIAISGIFYPISALPDWIQQVAQIFPIYWLGLGMRSALLPDAAAVAEITGSWRHLETALVLGTWAVVGLIVAPIVLGRMTRRESGSRVDARRERAMQRTV